MKQCREYHDMEQPENPDQNGPRGGSYPLSPVGLHRREPEDLRRPRSRRARGDWRRRSLRRTPPVGVGSARRARSPSAGGNLFLWSGDLGVLPDEESGGAGVAAGTWLPLWSPWK